jgi:DNA-binding transcriptional LysR family regulator
VELAVHDVLSEPCIAAVAQGDADFALAAIRADTPELQAEPFCRDDFHLVCRTDHALAAAQPALPICSLGLLCIWLAQQRAPVPGCRAVSADPAHLVEVEQLATVMGLVQAGLGISVVPALSLFHFDKPGLCTGPCRCPGWSGRSTWCAGASAACPWRPRRCTA